MSCATQAFRILAGSLFVFSSVTSSVAAEPTDYPSRSITLIVPFAAGGPADVLARTVSDAMGRLLGQTFIVENVAGAGGSLGSARAAKASPDGYTLLAGHAGTHAGNVGLFERLPYDPVGDFEPIGFLGDVPQVIVVNPKFPANEPRDFFEYVRHHADKLTLGHAGVGSASHLASLLFAKSIGKPLNAVGYRGSGPAMNDLIGGQFDFMIDLTSNALPQIEAGTVRPIAVLRQDRVPALPNVPTTSEIGFPQLKATIWNVLLAPKATPPHIVSKLNSALLAALADPTVQARLSKLGVEPPESSAQTIEGRREFIKMEVERWLPIVKAAGASLSP